MNDDMHKLRWEEWKYRHDLHNRLVFRYSSVVAAICSLAYLRPEVVCTYQLSPSAFGTIALFIGALGFIHLILEYVRTIELRTMLRVFDPKEKNEKFTPEAHPIYFFLRYEVNFDYVMWLMVGLALIVLPIVVILIGKAYIVCPIPGNYGCTGG